MIYNKKIIPKDNKVIFKINIFTHLRFDIMSNNVLIYSVCILDNLIYIKTIKNNIKKKIIEKKLENIITKFINNPIIVNIFFKDNKIIITFNKILLLEYELMQKINLVYIYNIAYYNNFELLE